MRQPSVPSLELQSFPVFFFSKKTYRMYRTPAPETVHFFRHGKRSFLHICQETLLTRNCQMIPMLFFPPNGYASDFVVAAARIPSPQLELPPTILIG
jgi:hypothetical protein